MTGPMTESSSNVGTDEHNAVESSNVGHDQQQGKGQSHPINNTMIGPQQVQGNGSAAAQVGELHGFPSNLGNVCCAANVGRGQAHHCQYGGKQLGAPLGWFVSQALKEKKLEGRVCTVTCFICGGRASI